jgi:hypothetical protein
MAKNRVQHVTDIDTRMIRPDTRIKQLILFFVFLKNIDTCRIRLNYTPTLRYDNFFFCFCFFL